ncbi:hypothetical protein V2J09_014991 [Rumex salicifolius]
MDTKGVAVRNGKTLLTWKLLASTQANSSSQYMAIVAAIPPLLGHGGLSDQQEELIILPSNATASQNLPPWEAAAIPSQNACCQESPGQPNQQIQSLGNQEEYGKNLPSMQVSAYTAPEIHKLSSMKVLRPTFNPVDAKQVTKPVGMDHSMEEVILNI